MKRLESPPSGHFMIVARVPHTCDELKRTGPSLAFEKWYSHETSNTLSCGSTRGGLPPLVRVGSGVLPRENFILPDVRRDDFHALCDNFCP